MQPQRPRPAHSHHHRVRVPPTTINAIARCGCGRGLRHDVHDSPGAESSTHAVAPMCATGRRRPGVKASGGIRDAISALAMIEAGASCLRSPR